MKHFDLVSIVREIETENRIAVVSDVTNEEMEFLLTEARALPNGDWDVVCRRKKVEVV